MTDDEKVFLLKSQWGLLKQPSPPPDLLVAVKLRGLLTFASYAFDSAGFLRGVGTQMGEQGQPLCIEADRLSRHLRCELNDMLSWREGRVE